MRHGKAHGAMALVVETLRLLGQRSGRSPLVVFQEALTQCTPGVALRPVRVAGTTYLVPQMLSPHRAQGYGLRWLVQGARARRRGGQSLAWALAQECWEASQGQGHARGRCVETHRMALANRAFVRFRWW